MGWRVAEPVEGREGDARSHVAERASAFRDLVHPRLDASYRLAAVILGDRVEAEDAVHDAAVTAWRGFGGLRDVDSFDAWFRRILVNGCRDRLRVRARHRVVDVGRELTEADHPVAADTAARTADRDALDQALGTLAADHQVVIALRFHADLTVPAIAVLLEVPEGTVKSRLHHALHRLRAVMAETER